MRAALILVALVGCSSINTDQPIFLPRDASDVDAVPLGPTFVALNANIFQPKCAAICHSGGANAAGNMDLGSEDPYAVLVGVTAAGPGCGTSGLTRIVPGQPDISLLYQKVLAKERGVAAPCGDPMPQGPTQPSLSDEEIEDIRLWITAGAKR